MNDTIGNIPAEGFWSSMKILAEGIDRMLAWQGVETFLLAVNVVLLAWLCWKIDDWRKKK